MKSEYFAINGRYLTQELSGVQRYARNIVDEIDQLQTAQGSSVLSPQGADVPQYRNLNGLTCGSMSGYAWEQLELPIAARGTRLLNLCNMAPVIKTDQIVCIHDANVFTSPLSYGVVFRTAYRSLQPLIARRALKIATVSDASAQQIARYLPIPLLQVEVLPNGHEHVLGWRPDRASISSLLPIKEGDRPFVLAIGSDALHKNISLLLDIAQRLEELGINLLITGKCRLVDGSVSLPSNVYRCGRVSDDDLAYLFGHALCLAFPSLTEGFGLPIVEAMALGCPVISSDRASMPEVCGDAALLASPSDPELWVQYIADLLQSMNLRQEMAGRGLERSKMYSWRKSAKGYLDLLRSIS
jgi:glycosyltransferase involved in cell wall biosynthesis